MFLSRRATQAEYFDLPDRNASDLREGYRLLGRVNRAFQFAEPFQRLLQPWLGEAACRQLTLLDLGAGDGSLGCELTRWAAARGWQWRVVNLDLNHHALALNPGQSNVAASAMALPFADNSFDVVIATQMTHHLEHEAAVTQHFREALRVCREGVFICDLHRHPLLYAVVAVYLFGMFMPAHFRSDGLLSVKRGWRVAEWQRLAREAGMTDADVRIDFLARIILRVRKPGTRSARREADSAGGWRGDRLAADLPALAGASQQAHLMPPAEPAPSVQ
jgi:2-polyprenyl-3-methyl-5-hydroxy-6-metoxy-1,4-benzoquinol methylase